jgi:hypothetical protein
MNFPTGWHCEEIEGSLSMTGRHAALPSVRTQRASSANEPTSTRHNSTTKDPIQEAIKEVESREDGEQLSYREVAKETSPELTERRCRDDTKRFSARVTRSSASDSYSTHNRS